MKRFMLFGLVFILLGSTVGTQARGDDACHPFYVGASGGLALIHDNEDGIAEIAYEAGFGMSAFLGWQEGAGRIEFEANKFNADVNTVLGLDVPTGNLDIDSYMINGYLDLPISSRLEVYGGLGLGVARVQINSLDGTFGNAIQSTSDFGMAYQAKVGTTFAFTQRAELFGGYRFMGTESLTTASDNYPNQTFSDQVYLHSLEMGLRLKF